MKFSSAAVFTLLACANAAVINIRGSDGSITETRSLGNMFKVLPVPIKKDKRFAEVGHARAIVDRQLPADSLTALQEASTKLQEASTAVDAAIASAGGEGGAVGGGEAAVGGDEEEADPATPPANTPPGNGSSNGVGGGAGGAIQAVTLEGLLLPDGRIGADVVETDFDVVASVFKSAVVKGDGLKFSDLISFPDVPASMFDAAAGTKAFEISINDQSIFIPEGGEPQEQFRRADLLPSIISTAQDSAISGLRTIHFSLQQDAAKPLALATNEYQLSFLETADFESRVYDVRVGTGTTSPSLTGENIVVLGRSGADIQEMFVAPFSADLQNFAVTLDFDANTMQVFHSLNNDPLTSVTEVVPNDASGGGEYHFALLKLADAEGAQTAGIDEGIIYSGIFMEDSTNNVVTLS